MSGIPCGLLGGFTILKVSGTDSFKHKAGRATIRGSRMKFKDYYRPWEWRATPLRTRSRRPSASWRAIPSGHLQGADAELRMQEVNEAYAVLLGRGEARRLRPARTGLPARPGFPPAARLGRRLEFSGRGFSASRKPPISANSSPNCSAAAARRRVPAMPAAAAEAQAKTITAKLLLDLEDAFSGTNRQISLRVAATGRPRPGRARHRTLNVKIPVGVHQGQVIRLAGQGAPGTEGAAAGDLLLEVHFKPHPRFRPDGRDLHRFYR